MSDYWNKKLAELEEEKKSPSQSYWDRKEAELKDEEARRKALIKQKEEEKEEDDIAPIKSTKDKGGLDFFQKGAFEDGYQAGDVTKTVLGTVGDAGVNALKGLLGLSEGVADLINYGIAGVADKMGEDAFASGVREATKENLFDNMLAPVDNFLDKYSVLGRTSDAILKGVGQVGTIIATGGVGASAGLSSAGATALTTGVMGVSGMGSGMSEAYQSGATDKEAAIYGAISGASDAITELIFGGLGKGINAVGLSKGLSSADDMLAKKVSSMFTNQIMKNVSEYGIKAGAEGLEEVLAGIAQAAGKKATYMSEEEFSKILKDENLLEQFVVGAVTSGIAQAPGLHISNKSGTDFITGMTQNEQAVVDKEVENRIAEAEADGKKLTAKQKADIQSQVERDLEKGFISTDLIEEVVGGDTYKAYKDSVDREDALFKEYEELGKATEPTLAQQYRYRELDSRVKSIKDNDLRSKRKEQLDQFVSEQIKGSRLAESYREVERRGQKFTADLSKYDKKQQAVIQKAIDSGFMNNSNKTHEFVDFVAKMSAETGTAFDFTTNEKLKESGFALDGGMMPNGFKTKDGITLNMSSNASRRFVVGHEITHVLEGTELYGELQKAVFDYAKSKGEYDSRLESITALYKKYSPDADPMQELTADLVGEYIFSDQDFVNNLSVKNQNIFQKVYSEIKHLLKLATAGSEEARMLEKAKRTFEKAYRQAANSQTDADADVKYSLRKEAPPKKTQKAYKLMRLVDGDLYPLFIGNNEKVKVDTWYNADSPNLSQLKDLAPGTHLIDMETGEAITWDEYAEQYLPKKNGKPARNKPNKDDIHWANDNGYRFMHIEDKAGGKSEGTMLKQYGDTRAYYNWGVNGSSKSKSGEGSASLYALRPGWHFGELPTMHQIGYGGKTEDTYRLDNQVWVEVEMAADVDYNAEAEANWGGDIPTHIPEDGYYRFATNPTQKKTKGGDSANDATKGDWYVAGAFKVNRILSDTEADAIVEQYNKETGKNIPLDYRRKDGRKFNAETMSVEDAEVQPLPSGSVTKFSLSTWTPETQAKVSENLINAGFHKEDVDKWIKDTNSVAAVIAADKSRLDFEAADNQVMLKDNQEYIKTLDASTLCAKRLPYQGTFNAIQHRMPDTVLTSDMLIDLLNMMKKRKVQTPCGVCYVESRRRHLGKFAQQWLDSYEGEYKPRLDEITTSDGLEALRQSHPEAYESFTAAMNKKGSSNPKVVQLRTEYRNEIMSLTPAQIKKIEAIGGLRVQSFSDFETPHLLDMMQAVMDMSAKGLHSQAYTKVPNFAWVFGDTGIKINLSLIAEGNGFDSDGNLAFSPTEGMDINEAMKLRDAYSQNVGTIIVGANDQHILACMADDRIDFIIPFHRSGWGAKELDMMGMKSYTDYTYGQKEHDLTKPTKVVNGVQQYAGLENLYPPDYWNYELSGKENAERYLNLCAKLGREPKFAQFLVDNGDGSYSLQPDGSTDGYWKTLIDFKMYDNDGNGAAQQTVKPNFNMDEAYRVLNEYEGGANSLPVANNVVDEFVAKYEKKAPVQYSLSDSEGNQLTQEQVEYFKKSKMRDENGNLKPMYHGSRSEAFTEFDLYEGVWLTADPRYAEVYAGQWHSWRDDIAPIEELRTDLNGLEPEIYSDPDYRVYKMYANIKNPVDVGEVDIWLSDDKVRQLARALGIRYTELKPVADDFMEEYAYMFTRSREFIELAKSKGFDGLKATEKGRETWCAIVSPDQVKLTTNQNPTESGDIRYSLTEARELENAYQYNLDNDDMIGAEMVVEQMANLAMPDSKIRGKDGKLIPVYHGTREMFWKFDTSVDGGRNGTAEGYGIYTSDDPEVTAAYGGRQIKMYANITKPATSTKRTITASKLAALIKDTCKRQAQKMVEDGEHDSVKEALFDTWVSNYVYTYDIGMDRAYRETANSILQMDDNDMAIIQEVMAGMGIRDYAEATDFYRESLTPITGFDGFVTQWENGSTGKKSKIILALDSKQLKSADAVTYDDNGNVIPLSERFNTENDDIRYSLTEGDDIAPDPLSDALLREDIAPAARNARPNARDVLSSAPTTEEAPAPEATVAENATVAAPNVTEAPLPEETDAPPQETEEEHPIKTVKERLTAKLGNRQTELANIEKLREDAIKSYDEKIAKAQATLDGKKNKDTKVANNLKKRIERLKRLKADIVAGYSKRINDIKKGVDNISVELEKDHTERDRYEKALHRINTALENDKAALTAEYAAKKAEQQNLIADKNTFVSHMAKELYDELKGLRKGVRASTNLASLLDGGYEWNSLKSGLSFVRYHPDSVVNADSEAEAAVRQLIEDAYDDAVYKVDDLDMELAEKIQELEAKAEEDRKTARTATQRRLMSEKYTALWQGLIGDTSTWKDMPLGLQYKTKTLRRILRSVVRDGMGNRDIRKADAIYDELETKYDHNEAQLKVESQKLKEAFRKMDLTHEEDTYAQMLGELRHNPETELTEDVVKEYYNKHKRKIDSAKVDKAIQETRKLYDDLIVRVNEVLKRQGMKEIPYRQGYFPHFTNPKQGWLGKLLNWKTIDTEIPTSIAGLTQDFKPQRSWQSFSQKRQGDTTDYSLYQGLDRYIHGALDWIYHIEDIQKRRALENYIRFTHSDEGIQKRINEIKAQNYDADEAQTMIDAVLKEAQNPLSGLVRELMNRTNTLANKKSSMDREMEDFVNRKAYSTMTNLNNRVTANMVVGSLSSAMTNFIPMVQSWHQVSPVYTVKGLGDMIRSTIHDDGTIAKSDFLTNRLVQEENLYKTGWDKVADKAAIMMNVVDNITAQTVWRSKYLQNLHEGMSEAQAIKDADQFAKNLMGGRSRGNAPSIFDAKNPITKIFTAFQLEVANQYGYMFEDVPQDTESKARLVKGYATAFVGAYMYNALYSALVGRDAAFDPISIIEDLLKDLFGDDEEEPEDIIMNFGESILEEVPYVGGLLGGGRIPISSALPYANDSTPFESMLTDLSNGDLKAMGKEMLKPLYYLAMPVAGGQIKKTAEGLSMFSDDHPIAGSYTDSGKLRYPVDKNIGTVAQAALFGQYSSKNARDYFDNERSALGEKQIQEFMDVGLPIQDYWQYRDGLKGLSKLEEKIDYINGLDLTTEQKNVLVNNLADRKEAIDMTDYDLYSGLDEFDYANKNPEKYAFFEDIGISYEAYKNADDDTKDAYDWAFNNPDKYPMSKAVASDVVEYRRYASELYDIKADKDENGKSISGSRKEKVLDYINGLDIDYGAKLILFKNEYNSDDESNEEIIEYLNSRSDISFEEEVAILRELGFTVTDDGTIYWD